MNLILASGSPRRLQILRQVGIEPIVICPQIEEKMNEVSAETADLFLEKITFQKIFSVYKKRYFNDLIVGADTIVLKDQHLFGKPADRSDAARMLRELAGGEHQVKTAVGILHRGETNFLIETSRVYFSDIDDQELEYYLQHEHYLDKAGAYAIQGLAALFIRKIEGCFFNVMGFPVNSFFSMLKKNGITFWKE